VPELKTVLLYTAEEGWVPFNNWLSSVKNLSAKARIRMHINRLRLGLFGNSKSIGKGLHELRIDEGKGYRVYYGNDGKDVVVLLCGSAMKTQQKDITKAMEYWHDYQSRTKN